jgi:hypothetical protein
MQDNDTTAKRWTQQGDVTRTVSKVSSQPVEPTLQGAPSCPVLSYAVLLLYSAMLSCSPLHCTVHNWTALCVVFCAVLYYSAQLYCIVPYFSKTCTALFRNVLKGRKAHCTVLSNTVPCCGVWHGTVLHCAALCCAVLWCAVLHGAVLYCLAPYCIVLSSTVRTCLPVWHSMAG